VLLTGKFYGDNEISEFADRFLRSAEPPAHDKWEFSERIKSAYARGAGKLLADFKEEVTRILRDKVVGKHPGLNDGPKILKDLLVFPNPVTKNTDPFAIKHASITLNAATIQVSAKVQISKKTQKTFVPTVRVASDSGSGVVLKIEDLQANGVSYDPLKGIPAGDMNKTFSINFTASSPMEGLNLSRCEFQISGSLKEG
jgi:hypothetical protein